jgi:hypothetical protein
VSPSMTLACPTDILADRGRGQRDKNDKGRGGALTSPSCHRVRRARQGRHPEAITILKMLTASSCSGPTDNVVMPPDPAHCFASNSSQI